MNNQKRVDGFDVIVHQGREITQAQFDGLLDYEKNKVVMRVNGPHHSSKWAQDRAARRCLQHSFGKVFDKEHPVLVGPHNDATFRVNLSQFKSY